MFFDDGTFGTTTEPLYEDPNYTENDTTNNVSPDEVTLAEWDLSIEKTLLTTNPTRGGEITYQLEVTNE